MITRKMIIIAGICILMGLPFGCTNPDLSNQPDVVEGQPATIAIQIQKGEAIATGTRASNAIDNDIKHVYILIFDAGSGQPLKTLYKSNYTGSMMQISTRSGESIIQVVANVGQNPLITGGDSMFDDVVSLAGFQQKMAKISIVNPASGQVLPMSGQTTGSIIIPPGSNSSTIEIPIQRMTAKISLQVLTQLLPTDKVDLLSWEVINTPEYSYIAKRANQDAVTDRKETAGDSNYFHSPAQSFKLVNYSTGTGNTMVPGAEFYQFENRKGNVASINTQQARAAKAPARATFIKVNARYQNALEVKNVTYLVYLGKNNTTNFDVERNTHHNYTMTINGLSQYSTNVDVTNIDSRVVIGDTIFAVDLFEPVLDAHYDWRPIRMRTVPGYSRVDVIDDGGNIVDINNSWLKLSLNKTWPTNAEIAANAAVKPVTHLDVMQHNPGEKSKQIYLYADEMFINDVPITDTRTLYLRFTFTNSSDPNNLNILDSCYTIVKTISQRPALTMGNMGIRPNDINGNVIPGVGNVVALERRDEFTMQLGATGLAATPLSGIRWGFSGLVKQPVGSTAFEFYRTNGLYDTKNLVYTPSLNLWDQANPAELETPPFPGDFDAIYNTYAARYAINKNRDLNGNGILDDDEIKWYLPSRAELILLWVGKKGSNATTIEQMTASYWSSSEQGLTGAIDLNFSNGGTGGDIKKNFGDYVRVVRKMTDPNPTVMKSPYVINQTRQVTGLPAGVSAGHPAHIKGIPYPLHGSEGALNTVSPIFEVAQQDCGINGVPDITGPVHMLWYIAAGRTQDWNNIANPATGCNAYWEVSPDDPQRGAGMWRMPTQRELMIIWMLRKEFLYDNFTPLKGERYWSAPNYYQQSWFTDFSNGYTGAPNPTTGDPNPQYYVRCVRDVTP